VVYVGSSAGSVLACPTIEHIEDMDDRNLANLTSFKGVGLVDTLILPHYGEGKYKSKFNAIHNKWQTKHKMMPLSNHQALVVKDDYCEIIGS
jgi:dipeptidase E